MFFDNSRIDFLISIAKMAVKKKRILTVNADEALAILTLLKMYHIKSSEVKAWISDPAGQTENLIRFIHPWSQKPTRGDWEPLYAGPRLANICSRPLHIPFPVILAQEIMTSTHLNLVEFTESQERR
jgi:hypothetical protein